MTDINCELCRDLLTLYVDDAVSEYSKNLVENHLKSCQPCLEYYQELQKDDVCMEDNLSDKKVIKKIRKSISRKRVITVCISVAVVLIITLAVFYFGFVKDYYVPFENSGLQVEKNGNIISNTIGHVYSMYPENADAGFLYVARTFYDQKHTNTVPLVKTEYLFDYLTFENGETYSDDQYVVKELYYVPQDCISKVRHIGNYDIEELKSVSQLIWKAE